MVCECVADMTLPLALYQITIAGCSYCAVLSTAVVKQTLLFLLMMMHLLAALFVCRCPHVLLRGSC